MSKSIALSKLFQKRTKVETKVETKAPLAKKIESKTPLVKKIEAKAPLVKESKQETKKLVAKREQKVKSKALDPCVCTPETLVDFCVTVTVPRGFEAVEPDPGEFIACVSTNTNDLHCQNLKCAQTVDILVDNPCAPDTPIACQGTVELNKLHYCGSINVLVNLLVQQDPAEVGQVDPDICGGQLFVSRYISVPVDQDICVRCQPFDCSTLISPLTDITNFEVVPLINNNPDCEPSFVISGTLNFDTTPCTPQPVAVLFTADGQQEGNLYVIDETTAAATTVGPLLIGTDPVRIGGMAYDYVNDIMYGITTNDSTVFPSNLVTINTSTAAVTVVGALGLNLVGMSFNFDSSILYGIEGGAGDQLVTIDTGTGVATPIGSTGTSPISGGGLTYFPLTSSPQVLYLSPENPSTQFVSLNPADGSQTGSLALSPNRGFISGMTTNIAETLMLAVNFGTLGPELISIDGLGTTVKIGDLPSFNDAIAKGIQLQFP